MSLDVEAILLGCCFPGSGSYRFELCCFSGEGANGWPCSAGFMVALSPCAWLICHSCSFPCWLLFREAAQKMGLFCCARKMAQKTSRRCATCKQIIAHINEDAGQQTIPVFLHNCLAQEHSLRAVAE